MRYLLNTNHAVALLNEDARLVRRLSDQRMAGDEFAMTTITIGELYYGAYNSERVERNLERMRTVILPNFVIYTYDVVSAEEFGKIQAELRTQGTPIPAADAQIAAIARRHGLTVLTSDLHFRWVDGLKVEDWLARE